MRHLIHLMCPLVIATASSTARAGDPATAEQHLDEGTKLYNVQEYDKAAEEYQAAYLLDPKPEYLYAVAQAQRLGGDCTKALQSYRAYLRSEPSAEQREKAEKNIERCTEKLQHFQLKITVPRLETKSQSSTTLPTMPQPVGPPPPTKNYVLGHILVGVGVAAIGGGAYFYRKGNRAIETHNSAQTYDTFDATNMGLDDARRQQTIGVSAAAAGGGLLVGGILYYVLHARTPVETSVAAQVKSDGTMVVLQRSF
jgi:tetratricopeptide (TPR) repeat protein